LPRRQDSLHQAAESGDLLRRTPAADLALQKAKLEVEHIAPALDLAVPGGLNLALGDGGLGTKALAQIGAPRPLAAGRRARTGRLAAMQAAAAASHRRLAAGTPGTGPRAAARCGGKITGRIAVAQLSAPLGMGFDVGNLRMHELRWRGERPSTRQPRTRRGPAAFKGAHCPPQDRRDIPGTIAAAPCHAPLGMGSAVGIRGRPGLVRRPRQGPAGIRLAGHGVHCHEIRSPSPLPARPPMPMPMPMAGYGDRFSYYNRRTILGVPGIGGQCALRCS
jgi:hypothetical protein